VIVLALLIATSDDVVVTMSDHAGSDVKEVTATGTFDAPPDKVHAVLDDLGHYKDFMPYTEESHEIARAPGDTITYERIHAPLSDRRDYTIHVRCSVDDKGRITHSFSLANDKGPPAMDGVVRIQLLEGHWLLEPVDGGKRTKATYWVYTTPGGSIPAFVVNMANNTAVPGLYAAVKKRLASSAR
jgi:hypothetical protein